MVVLAALGVGAALAWEYAKDQTPTQIHDPANNTDPIPKVLLQINLNDSVTAIVLDSLRFCAYGNLSPFGFDLHCNPDASGGIGEPITATDDHGFPGLLPQFVDPAGPNGEVTVYFVPNAGHTWGDVCLVGTPRACITGLVETTEMGLETNP